jgi:hypothetical protein
MTAMSAPRASETPSIATSPRDVVASLRTVQVPASPATYANRAALRAIGLRWDPEGHQWHGTTTADRVRELRERLGLEVRVYGTLEPPRRLRPPRPPAAVAPGSPAVASDPVRRARDGSRTHFESRIVFPGSTEDADEITGPTRRFTLLEITSGIPDDSREADERAAARRLRELRARVKAARAVGAAPPGLAETLASDWRKATRFHARFGITEAQFRSGVPSAVPSMAVGHEGLVSESVSSNPRCVEDVGSGFRPI